MAGKLKEWLFGRDGKGKGKGSDKEAEAIAALKKRMNKYEIEGRNLQTKIGEEKQMAKQMLASGNKMGARQALTRSNLHAQKYNNVQNMMLNLSTQIDTISNAKDTVETVQALKVGKEVVDASLSEVTAVDSERIMAELEEQRERVSMMNESLADISSLEMDLDGDFADSIDDQMAALEMEMQSSTSGDLPEVGSGAVSTPAVAEEPEKEKETAEVEDELESLKKELEGK